MALLAEELVEEYFNRKGYFTIRGIKVGVQEIDILGTRVLVSGERENVHIEVQASIRPISYISKVPIAAQRNGRPSNSMKRSEEELVLGVEEWVSKKFFNSKKEKLLKKLFVGTWKRILIINKVKSEAEVELIKKHRVEVLRLPGLIHDINSSTNTIKSASHADFVDLLALGQISGNVPDVKT
ncbi:MAG: hypothetical protein U5P10_14845 [Spirochaetia bacterium]|nr:hypothetical protein [Spirochaetia bacterium]